MKKACLWCAWLTVLLLSPLPVAAQTAGGYPARPGEVLLKLEPGASAQDRAADRAAVLADLGASSAITVSAGLDLVRITRFTVDQAITAYSAHPKVQFIEPNYLYRTVVVPNDPGFSQLWGLQNTGQTGGTPGADIDASLAWNVITGSEILVAIIDTGIHAAHPDLSENVFVNPGETAGNGVDDDGNGFVDDVRGWDFVNDDNNPADDVGHGTHVAGTVGAIGDNGIGVVGVNWRVRMLPIKFLDAFGTGSAADAVSAVNYAVRMGAKVINASWGGGGPSEALQLALEAAESAGVLFVAAAGNEGRDNDLVPNYPSNYDLPNVVAVAASDAFDRLPPWSNYGATTVDLAAPGDAIRSTLPGGYGTFSGTSMATPHVTGALALVLGRFPAIPSATAKALLLAGVDPLTSLEGRVATGGRLNVWAAVQEPDEVAPGALTDLLAMDPDGSHVTLRWTASGDDGAVGRASRYEVRYATVPIDDANFGSAELAQGAPRPAVAGAAQEMQVRGLTFRTTYYFAIKSFDELDNVSPLSNVVSATTLGAPVIGVTPGVLQADLLTGGTASQVLTVNNTGDAELNFQISIQSLSSTTANNARIVRTFTVPEPPSTTGGSAAPGQYPVSPTPYAEGQTPARGLLELNEIPSVSAQSGSLRILLLHTGDVFEIQAYLSAFPDIDIVDEFFTIGTTPSLAQLLAYDAVIVAVNIPLDDPVAMGDLLADYVDGGGGVVLTVASFLNGWAIQGRFLTDGYSPFLLGVGPTGPSTLGFFDPSHPIMAGVTAVTGDLLGVVPLSPGAVRVASWFSAQPMVATKGPRVAAVNIFVAAGGFWTGDVPLILHNAALWASEGRDWLSAAPDAAVVPAGGQLGVVVTFDAAGLDGGDYESRLTISSDDPSQPRVEIPALLHVTAAARILLEGEPVVVESAVDFASDGAMTTHRLPVTVPAPVGSSGALELVAEGDFGEGSETATVVAEGRLLGSVGEVGLDCASVAGTFPQDGPELRALVADGVVEVEVHNAFSVNPFCETNRHTIRLRYPSRVDRLDFGPLFVGLRRELAVTVRNIGSEVLELSIASDRGEFTPSATALTVAPRSARRLAVTFAPGSAVVFQGTLRLTSNDPDAANISIALAGAGVPPPDIAFAPGSIVEDLLVDGSSVRALRIANDGETRLEVSLALRLPPPAFATASGAATPEGVTRATPIGAQERARHVEGYRKQAKKSVSSDRGRRGTGPNAGVTRPMTSAALQDLLPPHAFVLFSDDMESGPGAWAHYATAEGSDLWSRQSRRSSSGAWSWNVAQHNFNGSDALQSPAIDLTGARDATLRFMHAYDFDDCASAVIEPDGGIVEVSTDGGAHWRQIVPAGRYPFVLDDICFNPLARREAYAHDSGAGLFAQAEFDLTPFVGTSILLRFHAGWDCGNCDINEGWFIDDVVVYSRGPAWASVTPATITVDPHGTATASISFDATGLAAGPHDSELVLSSNDPDEPVLVVPVRLQVADVPAQMELDPGKLNLKRRGEWVTANVLLPPSIPRESVLLSTLRLNRVVPADLAKSRFCSGHGNEKDCDLILEFSQDLLVPTLGDENTVKVVLTGEVSGGHRLLATQSIEVKRPKIKKPGGSEQIVAGSSYTVEWESPAGWNPTYADVYVSLNGGVSWSPVAAGVPGATASWTVPNRESQFGLFRVMLFDEQGLIGSGSSDRPFAIGQIHTAVDPPAQGGRLGLLQNRPNPFRSATGTSIEFELARPASVRLAVYDVRGNLVRKLVDAWLPAGRHDTAWNGRDRHGRAVPSGIYFCELREGKARFTKRMVVVR